MKNKTEHRELFGPGGCLTKRAIQLFIDKQLTNDELKKIKHHTKKCSLCAETLEGARLFPSGSAYVMRVNAMYQSKFRRSLDNEGRSRKLFYGLTSAAASVALLFGVYYIIQLKDVVTQKSEVAQNTEQINSTHTAEIIADSLVLKSGNIESETKTYQAQNKDLKSELKTEPVKPQKIIEELRISEPEVIISDPEIIMDDIESDIQYDVIEFEDEDIALEAIETEAPENLIAGNQIVENAKAENMTYKNEKIKTGAPLRSARKTDRSFSKSTYYVAEVMPMFQGGGVDQFSKYIADSLKVILPDTVLRQSIIVAFRIDTMGNVDKVNLISGTDSEVLNKQVIQIIENSPKWIPASISGKPIESEQEIEVVLGK